MKSEYNPGYCFDCGAKIDYSVPRILQIEKAYCDACIDKKEAEEEAKRRRKEQEKADNEKAMRKVKFIESIPPRYRNINNSLISENVPSCSIFYGGFGTGKTWRAYQLIYKLYTSLEIKTYNHVTEIGLLNEIKGGFNNNSFETRVNSFKDIDMLIVDEMGKNNDTDFNKAQIFEILNYRYDWEKKTILICNCERKEELYDILSPAILDRFRENIVYFGGSSKRYS